MGKSWRKRLKGAASAREHVRGGDARVDLLPGAPVTSRHKLGTGGW